MNKNLDKNCQYKYFDIMNDEEISFVKLNENNYNKWKFGINIVLRSVQLVGYVDGSVKEPDKEREPNEWQIWNRKSLNAMDIIIGSVETRLHRYLLHCTSAHETWNVLKERYGKLNEDPINLYQEFFEFQIESGVDIVKQLAYFKYVIEKLDCVGQKPTDAMIQAKILHVLPEWCSPLRMIWDCFPSAKRNTNWMINWIISEDERRKTEKSIILLSQSLGEIQFKKHQDQSMDRKKKPIKKKNTEVAVQEMKSSNHKIQAQNEKNDEKQVIASVNGIFSKTAEIDDDSWLADTSATMHMTFRKDFFTTFDVLPENLFVKVADNRFLHVVGKGMITVTEKLNGKITKKKLQNVLLVPDLKRNLFSISTINDRNFSFYACKSHCEVLSDKGRLLCRGIRQNKGIFKMLFKVKPPVPEFSNQRTGIPVAQISKYSK